MPQCSFNRPAAMMQATPVQNMFLIEYMPKAPDAYVKVYLYGLMQCCNPTLAQDSLEEALGMDAQAVAEAFVYWQAQGLVSILAQDPLRERAGMPPSTRRCSRLCGNPWGKAARPGCFSLGRCSGSTIGWRYSAWKRRRPSC